MVKTFKEDTSFLINYTKLVSQVSIPSTIASAPAPLEIQTPQ